MAWSALQASCNAVRRIINSLRACSMTSPLMVQQWSQHEECMKQWTMKLQDFVPPNLILPRLFGSIISGWDCHPEQHQRGLPKFSHKIKPRKLVSLVHLPKILRVNTGTLHINARECTNPGETSWKTGICRMGHSSAGPWVRNMYVQQNILEQIDSQTDQSND